MEVVYDAINLLCKKLASMQSNSITSYDEENNKTMVLDNQLINNLLNLLSAHTYDSLTTVLLCSFKYASYHVLNCMNITKSNRLVRTFYIIYHFEIQ